jgi:hypothetical protein
MNAVNAGECKCGSRRRKGNPLEPPFAAQRIAAERLVKYLSGPDPGVMAS